MEAKDIAGLVITSAVFANLATEWAKNYFNKGRNRAETDHIIVQMYDKLLDELRTDVTRLKGEVDDFRKRESAWLQNQNQWLQERTQLMNTISERDITIKVLERQILAKDGDISKLSLELAELKKQH